MIGLLKGLIGILALAVCLVIGSSGLAKLSIDLFDLLFWEEDDEHQDWWTL